MNILELFPCSGGLAEGFRRVGLAPTMAFDFSADACDSYEANHGHRPVQMDVRDLLRMIRAGWSPGPVDLLAADPPCTPWSRAGKREGLESEHDMLEDTVEIVRLLAPRFWLIANVQGLDDNSNWPVVQRVIGSLSPPYCIDFARLDAADFGVPQHRVRPFWFGHRLTFEHIRWPARTHGDPAELAPTLPGMGSLLPWVTCRQALGHLPPEERGSPIRLRWRGANGNQIASVPDRPARVVGTSNLSDGNVLAAEADAFRPPELAMRQRAAGDIREHAIDEPARTVRASRSNSERLILSPKHPAHDESSPAHTIRGCDKQKAQVLLVVPHHPPSELDEPSRTIRATDGGTSDKFLRTNPRHPVNQPDEPSVTVRGRSSAGAQGAQILEWPWDRPATTVLRDPRLAPPGHHEKSFLSDNRGHGPNAIRLSEKACAILQGFPERWVFCGKTKRARWAQLGMAMPPALGEAVARSIADAMQKGR